METNPRAKKSRGFEGPWHFAVARIYRKSVVGRARNRLVRYAPADRSLERVEKRPSKGSKTNLHRLLLFARSVQCLLSFLNNSDRLCPDNIPARVEGMI